MAVSTGKSFASRFGVHIAVFIFVALDRKSANLGLARLTVKTVEGKLQI